MDHLFEKHGRSPDALLPILHALKAEYGAIPAELLSPLAKALTLTIADVHGVISFYPDFREKTERVKLCRGESCQAAGGRAVETALVSHGISFTPVYCLGHCAVSPAMEVDGSPHGLLTAETAMQKVTA